MWTQQALHLSSISPYSERHHAWGLQGEIGIVCQLRVSQKGLLRNLDLNQGHSATVTGNGLSH